LCSIGSNWAGPVAVTGRIHRVHDQRAAIGGGQYVVGDHRVAAHPVDAVRASCRRQLAHHRADQPAGGGQLACHFAADAAVRAQYQCSALMFHVCLRD
jgi:hypothetical protein